MPKVYIGIGSNLGDRRENIRKAVSLLRSHPKINFLESSSIYETEPFGYRDQPNFLNGVISLETSLTPIELLDRLQEIEAKLKRKRRIHWGPRTVDLDILFYGGERISTERLTIPHPELHKRAFVLVPLSEIAGDFVHPKIKMKIREILAALEGTASVNSVLKLYELL